MLGELARGNHIVVCDLEAGVGTLLRMEPDDVDVVLVVAEPTAKSLEVARRAHEIAAEKAVVHVIANRVQDDEDAARIREAFPKLSVTVVPDDDAILDADRDGRAPVDTAPQAPAVRILAELAGRLAEAAENGAGDVPSER